MDKKKILSLIIKHTHSVPLVCRLRYLLKIKRWPRTRHPRDLNEKIQWLEFNTDTTEWTRLADKHRVREFVRERGLQDILVEQYAHYYDVDQIDFDSLPDKFVIKSNNGYGTVKLVRDKSKLDREATREELRQWLKEPFGYLTGEPHYTRIRPCIIFEELLEPDPALSSSLVDYKFWCFNGKPYPGCFVCTNRDSITHKYSTTFYSLPDWELRNDKLSPHRRHDAHVPKPSQLAKMMACAEALSKGFPAVRVDLYEVNGKVYFGEMTFTGAGARMTSLSPESLLEMGALVPLPTDKR